MFSASRDDPVNGLGVNTESPTDRFVRDCNTCCCNRASLSVAAAPDGVVVVVVVVGSKAVAMTIVGVVVTVEPAGMDDVITDVETAVATDVVSGVEWTPEAQLDDVSDLCGVLSTEADVTVDEPEVAEPATDDGGAEGVTTDVVLERAPAFEVKNDANGSMSYDDVNGLFNKLPLVDFELLLFFLSFCDRFFRWPLMEVE